MARLTLLPNLPTDLRKLHGSCYTKPASLADVMFDQLEWLICHASGKCPPGCPHCARFEQVKNLLLMPFRAEGTHQAAPESIAA